MRHIAFFLLNMGAFLTSQTFAQGPASAPFQTTPTPSPREETTAPNNGLLIPDGGLPEGFTLNVKKGFQLDNNLENDVIKLETSGGVHVLTNRGDNLRSTKATLLSSETGEFTITFFDNVTLRSSQGIEIFADKATIDEAKEIILFTGNVSAYQGSALHRGESATYHYETRKLATTDLRTSFDPILLDSGTFKAIEREGGTYYQGFDAGITTHDAARPNFWLRGENVTIIPGDKVRFKNLKLYAGDRPILWLPGLTQKFDGEFNYRPRPGLRSNWGPYLLNEYSHDLGGPRDPQTGTLNNPSYRATWRGDIYSRRGLGLGLDLNSYKHKDNPNLGTISLYHIYDFDPGERRSAEPRLGFDDPNRFIVQVRQRADANWLPGARGHIDLNSTLLSDEFFLEDFRPGDFATDFQPDNTLSLSQQWGDKHLLTAWTRFRINEFFQSDQRLPEIAFDQIRRPIFDSPILHESQNSIGLYREDLADFEEETLRAEFADPTTTADRQSAITDLLADTGFARFHTYHELSLPLSWKPAALQFTPRVGLGYTRYDGIEGPLDSQDRTLLHASVDASLKLTKRYPDWVSEKWGLQSALHVVQPYATATVLKTDDLDATFQPIERLTASTRPRALNVGRFAAIDDLTDWQILRLGTRNRILTKRNGASHQWLEVDTYIDIFAEDPEFNRSLSNLYTDIHWSPLPWFDLTVETQIPFFSESNFVEVATGLEFMPNADTEIGLHHRFLQDHPILIDSNRFELRVYHRFNEEWGAGTLHRWEFEDSTLEFQQYSLHRNLDSWSFTMGLFSRDNTDETEFGVLFGFTLTDFPSVSLPFRVDN